MERAILLLLINHAAARNICGSTVLPLEIGRWRHDLTHMDAAIVENRPVTLNEGQVYVYENYFPNRTIKYIHVDNLARKSCGASAKIKAGGVGTSSVLIVLHSEPNNEIRSVIDIWGTNEGRVKGAAKKGRIKKLDEVAMQSMKSLYLFKDMRTVNHNLHN